MRFFLSLLVFSLPRRLCFIWCLNRTVIVHRSSFSSIISTVLYIWAITYERHMPLYTSFLRVVSASCFTSIISTGSLVLYWWLCGSYDVYSFSIALNGVFSFHRLPNAATEGGLSTGGVMWTQSAAPTVLVAFLRTKQSRSSLSVTLLRLLQSEISLKHPSTHVSYVIFVFSIFKLVREFPLADWPYTFHCILASLITEKIQFMVCYLLVLIMRR